MRELLLALGRLLPPYNLARIFSYTRKLEEERTETLDRIETMEAKIEEQFNYILLLRQSPPLSVTSRQKAAPAQIPKRRSISELRAIHAQQAREEAQKRQSNGDKPQSMEERADEFASTQPAR